MFELIGSIFFL